MSAVFSSHASEYIDAGLVAFPVDTRAKKPLVSNWDKVGCRASKSWAGNPRFSEVDGIGVKMGRIVEVDVDAAGDAWMQAAVERFGDTPIKIRTASGKSKLWYRHNSEGRWIRPIKGQPIDILGAGFTIAPPSWREDLGTSYRFLTGSPANLNQLPCIRQDALSGGYTRPAEGVRVGERNNSVWRYCMAQARHCDDVEALIDVAVTWASAFPDPLPGAEIERCARSAWGYESAGRNFLGLKRPQISEADKIMDALLDKPDALVLYQLFQRWHSGRDVFAIAPRAMSSAGSPPWRWERISKARDVLIGRGFIEEVSAPEQGRRKAGRYRISNRGDGVS